jgi:hypothetical protein
MYDIGFRQLLFVFLLICSTCEKIDLEPNQGAPIVIESDSISFAVIGDYGDAGTAELLVAELVKSWSPDFIITLGDNNYDNGTLSTIKKNITVYYGDYIYNFDAPETYQCDGKAFEDKTNRFFPTLGNHDSRNINNAQPYLFYFSLPGKETYYDFEWGPVHFFTIHSGENGEASCCKSEQAIWLRTAMTQSTRPFKIVYFHHPPYSTSRHGSFDNLQWPFEEWGASAVFSGHEHNYQRIIKQFNPRLPYIVNGLGGRPNIYGCDLNPLDERIFSTFCFNENYGAIKVQATAERMVIQFFAVSNPGTPIDEFIIYN